MSNAEGGSPTMWDIAFREGYRKAMGEGHLGKPWWDTGDERADRVITKNREGQWVPAIPEPFYGLRKQCWEPVWAKDDLGDVRCDRKFWTKVGYRAHYALAHILRLS